MNPCYVLGSQMPTFLDLPHEILLWVFQSLDNVSDAIHLAKSCRLLSHVFDSPQSRRKILLSIIDNTLGTPSPDKTWLEAQFGADSLWKPAQSEISPELADPETRAFLTTVGFPITQIQCADFDSTHLSREERRLECYDGDELYGQRHPDDDSPPTNHCFHFGSVGEWMMMVGGEDGVVSLYDPGGWDHADGYQGTVAFSLESFAVLLGMLAGVADKLDPATKVVDDEDEGEEMRKAIVDSLRERMGDYDDCVFERCKFWDEFFECFLE